MASIYVLLLFGETMCFTPTSPLSVFLTSVENSSYTAIFIFKLS